MKKLLCFLMTLVILFSMTVMLTGCPTGKPDYKIGIITGSPIQGEEEYRTAQALRETYGDMIITATYPDNFAENPDGVTEVCTALAADPAVKAILWVQAIDGAAAAIEKVRQTRKDILFIAGVCSDTPEAISAAADICLQVDELSMGTTIIDQAYAMGAATFVHISFERHLDYATIRARRDLLEENCKKLGITYVKATAPDPAGEAGVEGARAWIDENIRKYVDQYGKDTAFFSTNCALQAPLIRQCAQLGAIYPQQCCPSPFHGYPEAFGISDVGHEGDVDYMLAQITACVADFGNSGRMSTWEVPVNMMMIEAGFRYACRWAEGELTRRCDKTVLLDEMKEIAGSATTISHYYDDASGELENYFLILCPFYNF